MTIGFLITFNPILLTGLYFWIAFLGPMGALTFEKYLTLGTDSLTLTNRRLVYCNSKNVYKYEELKNAAIFEKIEYDESLDTFYEIDFVTTSNKRVKFYSFPKKANLEDFKYLVDIINERFYYNKNNLV